MLLIRRAVVALVIAALALGLLAVGATAAAKVRVTSAGGAKVVPPSSILAGSLVSKGRVFYKTNIPENTLAGIRLAQPAKDILLKWGNPTRITLGTVQAEVAKQPGGPAGPNYIAPSSIFNQGSPLGDMLPSLPGLAPPGTQPAPLPGQENQGEGTSLLSEDECTWTYDLTNGITLEFIITDGIITQITVGGVGPWSGSKTRMGLQLGDSYKLVQYVCGWPESQKYQSRFLRVSYVHSTPRVLFTFLNKKVVGITIALVPKEISPAAGGSSQQ